MRFLALLLNALQLCFLAYWLINNGLPHWGQQDFFAIALFASVAVINLAYISRSLLVVSE